MIKNILLFVFLFQIILFADSSGVTKVYAHYEDAKSTSFWAKGSRYYWGQDKNLVIDGFEYNGHRYNYVSESANVKIRRSDNSNATGDPCGLFAEENGDQKHLKPTFPQDCDMAKIMAGRVINIGALDLFKNTGNTAKNIERVDFISPNGITAPSNFLDLAKAGHVVTEKSGNNEIKIAAILSLDANGDPSSYGPLVDIHGGGSKDYSLVNIYLPTGQSIYKQYFGFYVNEQKSPQGKPWYLTHSHEAMGMCFVSLKDLGISAGQKYYGFSYFGRDVTSSMNLVDYNSFPKTTGGDTADPYGGVASYFADSELFQKDYGDAPDSGTKYNYSKYHSDTWKNAERVTDGVYLGSGVTAENQGYFSTNADGDKDDVITDKNKLVIDKDAGTYSVQIHVSNKGSGTYSPVAGVSQDLNHRRYISAWIDWDNNGIYDNDEMIQGDYIGLDKQYEGDKTLTWDIPSGLHSGDKRYMRIRLTECAYGHKDDSHTISYGNCSEAKNGYASFGEIEDYVVTIDSNQPFTCSQEAYLFNGYPDSDAYTIDLSSGNYKLQKSSIPNRINATGYNIKDNYIWGYDLDTHEVIKIDANYKVTSYKVSKLPDLKYYAGDVSKEGILYLKANNNGKIYKIDLNSGIPKYDNYIYMSKSNLNFGDFAFNPSDNNLYSISTTDSHLYKIDSSNGHITDLGKQNIDNDEVKYFHTYIFDKNSNLYFYGTSGKIYKIDLSGKVPYSTVLFSTTNIKKEGGDGARCPNASVPEKRDDVCYAIDPNSDYLYTAYVNPGASPLPQATRKALDFSDVPAQYRDSLDGQSQAYNSKDGLIYRFREEDMYFYSIDPKTAKVHFIKKFKGLKEWIVGASFYGGYLYVIAKHYDESTLYKIDPSDWEIVSKTDVKTKDGKFVDVDSLAINSSGDAYFTDFRESKTIKHLYSLDLKTGLAKELFDISNPIDLEGLSFSKNDNLYISNSETGTSKDDDIISMLNISDGSRTAAAQVPKSFDAQINGLSCNVVSKPKTDGVCYAINKQGDLYTTNVEPDASPLPNASQIILDWSNVPADKRKTLAGEASGFYEKTGLIYTFATKSSSEKYFYSIDPQTGKVNYIKTFSVPNTIYAASFGNGYFYFLTATARSYNARLYTVNIDDWSIVDKKDLNGDIHSLSGMAINKDGKAYGIIDSNHDTGGSGDSELYSLDLQTAKTTYISTIPEVDGRHIGAEGLSFAKDGNLYVENSDSEASQTNDKLYKIDIETGKITPSAQMPHQTDPRLDIETVSCNVESGAPICEEGENLIKNGSFPDGENTPDWDGTFWTGTNPNYYTPDGMPYVYVDGDSSGKTGYQDVLIEAGKAYKLSFYGAYKDNYDDQKVSLIYLDANKNPVGVSNHVDITHNILDDNKLVPYTLNIIQAPDNARYLRVQFSTDKGKFLKVDGFDLRVDCNLERGISITDSQLGEEEAASGKKMKFVIATNLPAPDGGMDIKYKVVSKTATANADFLANPQTTYIAHIDEGKQSVEVFIPIIDDKVKEDAEYFEIQLQPYEGAKLVKATATGIIYDNDDTPVGSGKDGNYLINDKGYSDGKLRTKIAGTSPVVVIKAKQGFEIVHNRIRTTSTNCVNTCVCDPCGVPVCTENCATYANYKDENSSKMYVDKVVLYYKDGTTYELSGAKTLDSGESFELTLPTNKITKDAYIKVFGHSDTEYATGKSKDLTSVSDHFAIRPDRFTISLGGKTLTNPLRAEESVSMSVKAVDTNNKITIGYTGSNFKESIVDAKYSGDQLGYGLDITGKSFVKGEILKSLSYKEVGILTIKIEEKAPFFAEIDKDDSPSTYKMTPATYQVRIVPDHFDITYSLKDANPTDKLTFFANTQTTMGSKLSYTVTAKSKIGNTTTRYTSGKYSDDINITVSHSITTDTARNLTLNYTNIKGSGSKTFLSSSGLDLGLVLKSSDFSGGVTQDTVYENFKRDNTKSENPLLLTISKISAKEQHGVGSIKVTGNKSDTSQKAYFYYGRAHAPSPQISTTKSFDAKVYYEVYCKGCNKTIFTKAKGQASIDEVYWYILDSSTVTHLGSVCDYQNPRAINMSTATKKDIYDINLTAPSLPHIDKIYYTPKETFLRYNKFGTALPEHFFDVKFTSQNNQWAGEGDKGKTVDTNISKRNNQSIDW